MWCGRGWSTDHVQALCGVVEQRRSPSPAELLVGVGDKSWSSGVAWVELSSLQSVVRCLRHHLPCPTHRIAPVSLGFEALGRLDVARRRASPPPGWTPPRSDVRERDEERWSLIVIPPWPDGRRHAWTTDEGEELLTVRSLANGWD
jgi:hypothetical protein